MNLYSRGRVLKIASFEGPLILRVNHYIHNLDLLGRSTFGFFIARRPFYPVEDFESRGHAKSRYQLSRSHEIVTSIELPGTGGKLNILDLLKVDFLLCSMVNHDQTIIWENTCSFSKHLSLKTKKLNMNSTPRVSLKPTIQIHDVITTATSKKSS